MGSKRRNRVPEVADFTVLGLDLSTKSGWALMDSTTKILDRGLIEADRFEDTPYPLRLLLISSSVADAVGEIVAKYKPDVILIEELNNGRSRFTQKLLASIHYAVYEKIRDLGLFERVKLVSSSDWRKAVGLGLTKEDKTNNRKVNEARRAGKSKKELGLKGKLTWKHLSVRKVNEIFRLDLIQKDNDISDAILLGLAYIKGVKICEGK